MKVFYRLAGSFGIGLAAGYMKPTLLGVGVGLWGLAILNLVAAIADRTADPTPEHPETEGRERP